VKTALAGTNDSFFLSLCLDIAISSRVHTLLFKDHRKVVPELDGSDSLLFDVASEDDFSDLFEHYCATSNSMDKNLFVLVRRAIWVAKRRLQRPVLSVDTALY
jgi:hypothetical protein